MEELDCGVSRPTRACMERRTLVRADVGWTLNDNDDDDVWMGSGGAWSECHSTEMT